MLVEDAPEVVLFNSRLEERLSELKSVMSYLTADAGLKMHKAIQYDRAIEYFRGVQFHLVVLQNEH